MKCWCRIVHKGWGPHAGYWVLYTEEEQKVKTVLELYNRQTQKKGKDSTENTMIDRHQKSKDSTGTLWIDPEER